MDPNLQISLATNLKLTVETRKQNNDSDKHLQIIWPTNRNQ